MRTAMATDGFEFFTALEAYRIAWVIRSISLQEKDGSIIIYPAWTDEHMFKLFIEEFCHERVCKGHQVGADAELPNHAQAAQKRVATALKAAWTKGPEQILASMKDFEQAFVVTLRKWVESVAPRLPQSRYRTLDEWLRPLKPLPNELPHRDWRIVNEYLGELARVDLLPRVRHRSGTLTDGEKLIWGLLEGRAMSAKDVSKAAKNEKGVSIAEDLVRQHVKSTRMKGFVVEWQPGRGYFRPDAPPAEIAP